MIGRLRNEGPTAETHKFLEDEKIEDYSDDYDHDITDEQRHYEELCRYEWNVMLFEKEL